MAPLISESEILPVLTALAPNVDEGLREYMAGMLVEEFLTAPSAGLSADAVQSLIGPFLLDSGCVATDSEALDVCRELLTKVNVNSGSTPDKATDCHGQDGQSRELASTTLTTDASAKQSEMRRPVVMMNELLESGRGFEDPYLGISSVNVNFNSHVPINEAIKLHKALQREREKQLKIMREWEKEKLPLPSPMRRHGDKQLTKMRDVNVESFSVAVAGRELLKDSALRIVIGRKYGLIGRNGIGKSTLIAALVRGEIQGVSKDLSVGCVEQEIAGDETTAIQAVLDVDLERKELLGEESRILASASSSSSNAAKEKTSQNDKSSCDTEGQRLSWIYGRLQEIDSSSAPSEASSILAGLGLSQEMQETPTKRLSGGWRMRVALARALFSDPDILCLDEPTNHLDLHAVAWLSEYLNNWSKTCILVSHARNFLNDVCTDIIEFKDQTLKYYTGNYDVFEQVRADNEKLHQRQFEAQQSKRDHMQSFIDRFRCNAKRAALVQSRIKALEKLPMLDAVANDPTQAFQFGDPGSLSAPVLQLQTVSFSYKQQEGNTFILKDVDFSVDLDSRMAICGVNGSGKSTLLKLLTGQEAPTNGVSTRHNRLRIGFFNQHHVDGLDLTLNAVQQLQAKYPDANLKPEEARNYLGGFGITGLLGLEPLYILSGGQKSRVAIAVMAFNNPHILILDEPTNHLDLDAVQSLITALNKFEGGVVIVSHDSHLLTCVADEIWHVDPKNQSCTKFGNEFEEYKEHLLKGKV